MITLTICDERRGLIPDHMKGLRRGFRHFWGKYVVGFDSTRHCLPCLLGPRSKLVTRDMPSDETPIAMDEASRFDLLYLCGVSPEWATNFHMVLRPRPGSVCSLTTYTGVRLVADGAQLVDIPEIPRGFRKLPQSFTSCRNWQLGFSVYGDGSSARLAV